MFKDVSCVNRSLGGTKGTTGGRGVLNKLICYKTVLLLVLSPLQFGARDLGFLTWAAV